MSLSARFFAPLFLTLCGLGGLAACGSSDAASDEDEGALEQTEEPAVAELSDRDRAQIATEKATCPFVGALVAMKKLLVLDSAANPLARIEGEGSVAALGDTGRGSNLGSRVLTIFAKGNHHKMIGASGKLDTDAPKNTFSLAFPGSQGSHPGHSGILQGNPTQLNSGRFSAPDFQRLVTPKGADQGRCKPMGHAEQAPDGSLVVRRSEIGKFIAENLKADPNSKVAGLRVFLKLGIDAARVGGSLHEVAGQDDKSPFFVALTKLLGEDNLVGSAGEFALLMAFLEGSPKTIQIDGEPAVSVDDLTMMFGANGEKRLPEGWETWTKTRSAWIINTLKLTNSAALAHAKLTLGCK